MRHAYRTALIAEDEPPSPFLEGPDAFLAWLAEDDRWLRALGEIRHDLHAAFGGDVEALRAWATTKGLPGPHGLPAGGAQQLEAR